jgi:hypothetical protein
MQEFQKQIDNFTQNLLEMRTGLNEKLKQIQNENPNLCAEITNDFTRIFELAKDGDLTALNELKNKYQNADNINK